MKTTIKINNQIFNVTVSNDENGWTATEENYNGTGDHIRTAFSFDSHEDAIQQLKENLEDAMCVGKI